MTMHPIVFIENPTENDHGAIVSGISRFGAQQKTVGLGSFFYIVYDENKNIIAAMSGFDNFGPAEIGGLWVDEKYRHQGYGKALVAKAEEWANQKGCKMMTVFTLKNWPACAWYQKLGFKIEYERPGHAGGSKGCYLVKNI